MVLYFIVTSLSYAGVNPSYAKVSLSLIVKLQAKS